MASYLTANRRIFEKAQAYYKMKNTHGCTRIVFEFKTFVIKIPNFRYQWDHFLKGLLGNITENKTWKWNSGKYEKGKSYLICPVLWCSWGGWILIMKKADVKSHVNEIRSLPECPLDEIDWKKEYYKKWIDAGFGGDDKPDNYGYLNGLLVKIDYTQ